MKIRHGLEILLMCSPPQPPTLTSVWYIWEFGSKREFLVHVYAYGNQRLLRHTLNVITAEGGLSTL